MHDVDVKKNCKISLPMNLRADFNWWQQASGSPDIEELNGFDCKFVKKENLFNQHSKLL